MAASTTRWLPLESNPDSYTKWSSALGLDKSKWTFQEVYGLDDELLAWVKQPVKAVLLLFPITQAYEQYRKQQDEQIAQHGVKDVQDIIYFKQTIANACGTMALLHALANSGVPLNDGPLKTLFERAKDKNPYERAAMLVEDDGVAGEVSRVHESTASTGETATPALSDDTDLHFLSFVEHKGNLIELDGRRESPVNHGKIQHDLLQDSVEVIKHIIELSSGNVNFNVTTLSPAQPDE
ncbi:ubiquitinyl hydrolase 1 [Microbotryomycetes sp. JL221]|nr:ubiquitinyl hydrolase 1 [Microbotryomycetes sp. JL221]